MARRGRRPPARTLLHHRRRRDGPRPGHEIVPHHGGRPAAGDAEAAQADREHLPALRSDRQPLPQDVDGFHLRSGFGQARFRNEIVWRRTTAKGLASTRFASSHDTLLFYARGDTPCWNPQFEPHDPEYVRKFYRYIEEETGRRYRHDNLTNPNKDRPNLTYEFLGIVRVWRWTQERMQREYERGRVIQTAPGNVPVLKRYLDEQQGRAVDDLWGGNPVTEKGEATGYPTQKPVALLDLIIRATSHEGDMILDPFCGCATALVAADRLNREWAGIDLSPLAARLVLKRLREDRGPLFDDVTHRQDVPARTDLGELPNYRTYKHTLYGRQEGICGGRQVLFPFRNMTLDHVVARSRGGSDHIENLQLLCGACNSMKGAESQEYLVARLKAEGIRT